MARRLVHPLIPEAMQRHLGDVLDLRDRRLAEMANAIQHPTQESDASRQQGADDRRLARSFSTTPYKKYRSRAE